MLGDAQIPWAVAVLGGSLLDTPIARTALERGGHLRVGLEDFGGKRAPSNQELVREAVAALHAEEARLNAQAAHRDPPGL